MFCIINNTFHKGEEYRIFRIPTDSDRNIVVMSYEDARWAVEDHITTLFQLNPDEKLPYHNSAHTRKVAQRAGQIALFYKLDDEQLFIISTAVWFHDIGYLFSGFEDHEQEGIRLMNDFVSDIISTQSLVGEIEQCVMAAKRDADPFSLDGRIICDAGIIHFGTNEFRQTDPLIKKRN